jgi:integral membrane protein (TIGR01906 family)
MAVGSEAVAQARPGAVARRVAVVVVALLVPVLFVGNGIHLIAHEWFVRAEYARPGFPPDEFGMERAERVRLATLGLNSILPWNRDGVDVLRDARHEDGTLAFNADEVQHMQDVRTLLTILLALHATTLVALVVLAVRRPTRELAVRALRAGSFFTLGLFALVGLLLAVEPDWFLTSFHTIFFEGSSWRFGDRESLRRLFPDLFWDDTSLLLGLFASLQAAAVLAGTWWWRARRRPAGREEPEAAAAN